MTEAPAAAGNRAPLAAYAERIAPYNLAPLWDRLHDLVTPHLARRRGRKPDPPPPCYSRAWTPN